MLKYTFAHFPGITLAREIELWNDGYLCWEDLAGAINPIGSQGNGLAGEAIRSQQKLVEGDARFFGENLPSSTHWRAYPEFLDGAAFLDKLSPIAMIASFKRMILGYGPAAIVPWGLSTTSAEVMRAIEVGLDRFTLDSVRQ